MGDINNNKIKHLLINSIVIYLVKERKYNGIYQLNQI